MSSYYDILNQHSRLYKHIKFFLVKDEIFFFMIPVGPQARNWSRSIFGEYSRKMWSGTVHYSKLIDINRFWGVPQNGFIRPRPFVFFSETLWVRCSFFRWFRIYILFYDSSTFCGENHEICVKYQGMAHYRI
jgi:hypothetical protein